MTRTVNSGADCTRIGVDVGGTKIEAIALDPAGRELARRRIATPRGDYAATVAAIAGLATEMGEGSVGVGIPGALSRVTGRVKNANSTWLIGQDLKGDLERALGREVRVANDANCFALSEAVDGAGKGADVVFGVILGTGVGGGIAVRGRVPRITPKTTSASRPAPSTASESAKQLASFATRTSRPRERSRSPFRSCPLSQVELAFFTRPVRRESAPGMPTPTVPSPISLASPAIAATVAA